MRRLSLLALVLLIFLSITTQAQDNEDPPVNVLVPQVLNVYPHDTSAFTQGLLWHEGIFFESTGLRGESTLREVELSTGDVIRSIPVTRGADSTELDYFAEGLELVDDRLIQLTWQANVAFVYDLETFEQIDTFTYEGEGWGLCEADGLLYLSDGSDFIDVFDTETYELVDQFPVTYNGEPVRLQLGARGLTPQYNELECVGDKIYANAWQLDFIFAFDRNTGVLTDFIDARALLTQEERAELNSGQVLNGIAYNPDDDVFYITGKEWSKLFEVRFVPAN